MRGDGKLATLWAWPAAHRLTSARAYVFLICGAAALFATLIAGGWRSSRTWPHLTLRGEWETLLGGGTRGFPSLADYIQQPRHLQQAWSSVSALPRPQGQLELVRLTAHGPPATDFETHTVRLTFRGPPQQADSYLSAVWRKFLTDYEQQVLKPAQADRDACRQSGQPAQRPTVRWVSNPEWQRSRERLLSCRKRQAIDGRGGVTAQLGEAEAALRRTPLFRRVELPATASSEGEPGPSYPTELAQAEALCRNLADRRPQLAAAQEPAVSSSSNAVWHWMLALLAGVMVGGWTASRAHPRRENFSGLDEARQALPVPVLGVLVIPGVRQSSTVTPIGRRCVAASEYFLGGLTVCLTLLVVCDAQYADWLRCEPWSAVRGVVGHLVSIWQ